MNQKNKPKRHMQNEHPLFNVQEWHLAEISMASECGWDDGEDVLLTGPVDVGSCFDVHIRGAYEQLKDSILSCFPNKYLDDESADTHFTEPYPVDGYGNLYYVACSITPKGYAPFIQSFYIYHVRIFYILSLASFHVPLYQYQF